MKEKLRNLEKFFECLLFLIGERSRDQFAVFRLVAKVRQIIDSETRKKNLKNIFEIEMIEYTTIMIKIVIFNTRWAIFQNLSFTSKSFSHRLSVNFRLAFYQHFSAIFGAFTKFSTVS